MADSSSRSVPNRLFARPSKCSAKASASRGTLNSIQTSVPESVSRQEKVDGSTRCSSSQTRIADIWRERSPCCTRISTPYMLDARLFLERLHNISETPEHYPWG